MFALFYSDVTLIRHDADDAAFAWVEFYLPGVFPFSESHGLLEVGLVMLVFDSTVQKAVILQRV